MKEAKCERQRHEGKIPNEMGHSIVRAQTQKTGEFLSMVVNTVNDYLNQTTLESLQAELPIEKGYCCDVLSTLRRMAVFCEGGAEACRRLLMQEPFQEARAEKTLYNVYHQCIEEFFMPKKTRGVKIAGRLILGSAQLSFIMLFLRRLSNYYCR